MSKPVIELQHVYKKYKGADCHAVNDVSLTVEEGDFITILGTSGSGKTTLLKTINRIHELTDGNILFYGQSIYALPIDEYRRKIGYVIQQVGLFPHWTVEENIATVPKILKWKDKDIKARVVELLKMVQLDPDTYRSRYPSKLSGGEQQRVGIARAMAARPPIMLMDEPFGSIDAITRRAMQDELLRLQKQTGITIMFVTHDVQEAFKLGNKVIIMNNGVMQQYDKPYQIIINPANSYVSELTSASGDFYDKFKVLRVQNVLEEAEPEDLKADSVDSEMFLSEVFKKFLLTKSKSFLVRDCGGTVLGKVRYETIEKIISQIDG